MFLPEFDRDYLQSKDYEFREIEIGQKKGLIITDYPLPERKYNVETSDLLILFKPGYPDIPLDMWYFNPAILLVPNNKQPSKADHTITFDGRIWQRWSRHFPKSEWRSGRDGIHTFLKRIDNALQIAK